MTVFEVLQESYEKCPYRGLSPTIGSVDCTNYCHSCIKYIVNGKNKTITIYCNEPQNYYI